MSSAGSTSIAVPMSGAAVMPASTLPGWAWRATRSARTSARGSSTTDAACLTINVSAGCGDGPRLTSTEGGDPAAPASGSNEAAQRPRASARGLRPHRRCAKRAAFTLFYALRTSPPPFTAIFRGDDCTGNRCRCTFNTGQFIQIHPHHHTVTHAAGHLAAARRGNAVAAICADDPYSFGIASRPCGRSSLRLHCLRVATRTRTRRTWSRWKSPRKW